MLLDLHASLTLQICKKRREEKGPFTFLLCPITLSQLSLLEIYSSVRARYKEVERGKEKRRCR